MNVDLFLTYECNWHCEYCIVDTHNQKKINHSLLLEQTSNISEGSTVSLIGGEPGMLEEGVLDAVMNLLVSKKCKIELMTNGLFLERYPEYIDMFDFILYHCSENLIGDIKEYKDIENIEYQIVVTDNNFHRLDGFLAQNNGIKFSIFGAKKSDINVKGNILTKRTALDIIKKHKARINPESLLRLFECSCE